MGALRCCSAPKVNVDCEASLSWERGASAPLRRVVFLFVVNFPPSETILPFSNTCSVGEGTCPSPTASHLRKQKRQRQEENGKRHLSGADAPRSNDNGASRVKNRKRLDRVSWRFFWIWFFWRCIFELFLYRQNAFFLFRLSDSPHVPCLPAKQYRPCPPS